MSAINKKWMMFVDGENFTLRAQEILPAKGRKLDAAGGLYMKDVFFWPYGIIPNNHKFSRLVHTVDTPERCYYYTCCTGDEVAITDVKDRLWKFHFSPVVMKKPKGQKAKGVDISLTKDMLLHAFFGNYDVAVLVTGDGDYVPVVEEVKRLGKRVVVAFFEDPCLNQDLRRAADEFFSFG